MNKTVKFYLIAVALATSSSAFAVDIPDATAVYVDATNCAAATTGTRVGASKDVAASFVCDTGNVGIATAATKGRGKLYRIHSGGSVIKESDGTGLVNGRWASFAAAQAQTATQAAAALVVAGGSQSD